MKFYYKEKNRKTLKEVSIGKNKTDVTKALKAIGVKDPQVFTQEEAEEYWAQKPKKPKKKTPYDLLPASARIVWDIICEEFGYNEADCSTKRIKDFNLKKNTNEPYYIFYYWGSGSSGHFGTEADVKKALEEKIESGYNDGCNFSVFSIRDKRRCDVKYKLEVTIEHE